MVFSFTLIVLFFSNVLFLDAPKNFQMSIQDQATHALDGMLEFHHYLMFCTIQIVICTVWFLAEVFVFEQHKNLLSRPIISVTVKNMPSAVLRLFSSFALFLFESSLGSLGSELDDKIVDCGTYLVERIVVNSPAIPIPPIFFREETTTTFPPIVDLESALVAGVSVLVFTFSSIPIPASLDPGVVILSVCLTGSVIIYFFLWPSAATQAEEPSTVDISEADFLVSETQNEVTPYFFYSETEFLLLFNFLILMLFIYFYTVFYFDENLKNEWNWEYSDSFYAKDSIKLDSCSFWISETSLFVKRTGVFYGQCSEICGVNHGFMPIVVQVVSEEKYFSWYFVKLLDA